MRSSTREHDVARIVEIGVEEIIYQGKVYSPRQVYEVNLLSLYRVLDQSLALADCEEFTGVVKQENVMTFSDTISKISKQNNAVFYNPYLSCYLELIAGNHKEARKLFEKIKLPSLITGN